MILIDIADARRFPQRATPVRVEPPKHYSSQLDSAFTQTQRVSGKKPRSVSSVQMKALVYTRPMNVEVRDLNAPQLRYSDVLVRVRACGVCGSDLDGFRGNSSRRVPPLVLGHEFSGEIVEHGNSRRLRIGSQVAVYPLLCCGNCPYCSSGRENLYPSRRVFGLDLH